MWVAGSRKGGHVQLAALLFLLWGAGSLDAQTGKGCTPSFPFKDSWWGADAAYSIPLWDGRSVWIFGDTLYGDQRVVDAKGPRMVRNSIGISSCTERGDWKLDYVIRRGKEGRPEDFFAAQHEGTWYWAMDGFVHKTDLWVTLLCIRSTPKTTSDALGFETCGADLAKISGLRGDPQHWTVKYFPLVPDGVAAYPSATAVVEGDYAYLFALYEKDLRPMLLTRVPLKGLDAPAKHLQYLAQDGAWKPGLVPVDARQVMRSGNTEMTVRYHPQLKKWVAVLGSPAFFSDEILFRTAPQLTGPWSEGESIYHIPELQKNYAAYDKDTICYAAKEHPEFRLPGSILFTYTCNSLVPKKLINELDIYFPKVVRVPLPK